MTPFFIGISGPSGSGKTTVAKALGRELGANVISLDAYYHDLSHVPEQERARTNFDHPDALEHQLLFHHLDALRRGMTVKLPVYDFATHCRVPRMYRTVQSTEYVVVEGLFLLHWHQAREALDLRVYVDTEDAACFARRQERDLMERGRHEDSVILQYSATVRPMAEKFIHPSAAHADLTISGAVPVEESVARVLSAVRARQQVASATHG